LTQEFMDVLFTQHRIDYIIHGDDPCLLPDGTDVYDYPKRIGRFRMVCLRSLRLHAMRVRGWVGR